MDKRNLFEQIPAELQSEWFDVLAQSDSTGEGTVSGVRIERIVSRGQVSPETGWYDQAHREWVVVLKGHASILFEDRSVVRLEPGDWIDIPPHSKHRVIETSTEPETVWLAVRY